MPSLVLLISFLRRIDCSRITSSTKSGNTANKKNSGQMMSYRHESRMNHKVKRLPSKCIMICNRLNLAKMGTTLVPTIIIKNSKKHVLIMV